MKYLHLSCYSYYALCRYNAYRGEREAMWKDLSDVQGDHATVDMLCDWIMQCCYNG